MLSIIVLTKNEEKNILDCLESVSWADEIIVVDDYSTDLTEQVVKNFVNNRTVKFYKRRLENDFASQRNFGLLKANYPWVLYIDADERVSSDLRKEINDILIEKNRNGYEGYLIPRLDVIWGRYIKHGEAGNIKLLRLAKKNSGKWLGKVHETWHIKGKVGELSENLIHFPHQTVSEFLKEINFYTDIRAKELYENYIKTNVFQIIIFPMGKFIQNYFIKLGFLDGIEGLLFAILMSFHSFLVRSKLWVLWVKN